MNENPGALRLRDVQRRFDRAARDFHHADFVHRHAARGLFERLSLMQIDASLILDLGSAAGRDRKPLAKRYHGALVIGLDRSMAMLKQSHRGKFRFRRNPAVQADARHLPFADGSIDLVYANLLLPWIDDLHDCFVEITRVLRKDGAFVFSTLGPGSFAELRDAWGEAAAARCVRAFPDMHDVGDGLVRSGLRDPVLDVDPLAVRYRDADRFFADLRRTAAGNSLLMRERALTGKTRFRDLRERLTKGDSSQPITVTLELVYGHAWGSGPPSTPGEFRVPATGIPRRRR